MIEKFEKILNTMDAKGGNAVTLFALLKMDELTDRWTIIYSEEALELTTERRGAIFNELLENIRLILTADELLTIARIVVLNTQDHLAQMLLRYQSGAKISNEKVNGNFVHEGYILKAMNQSIDAKEIKGDTENKASMSDLKLE